MQNQPAPPIAGNVSIYNNEVTWCFFISFIVWFPFICYLWSHCWDHRNKNHYPHTYIVGLLAFGSTLRCIWFYVTSSVGHTLGWEVINRIATLSQFSAMTLLLLMWSKALKVDDTNHSREYSIDNVVKNNHNSEYESERYHSSNSNPNFSRSVVSVLAAAKKRASDTNKIMETRTHIVIFINVVAWCLVLVSIILEQTATDNTFKDIW